MNPSFYCVGAPKTATTSLFRVFVNSGSVMDSAMKEPHYLTYKGKRDFIMGAGQTPKIMDTWSDNLESYLGLYQNGEEGQLTADFSTHYLKDIELFKKNGIDIFGAKFVKIPIIVILRDPVDRAFSHYSMKVRDGGENLSFLDAIQPEKVLERLQEGYIPSFDYIGFSKYEASVKYLTANFTHVLILDHAMIKQEFSRVIEKLNSFLGLDMELKTSPPVLNRSGRPKTTGYARYINKLVFHENWIKTLLPDSLKNKIATFVKAKAFKLAMDPMKMTLKERDAATLMLQSEITFYNDLFNRS